MMSSPRERGSSPLRAVGTLARVVVPARAGVIRCMWTDCPFRPRRPRASGGHPSPYRLGAGPLLSSPRERGSSVVLRRRVRSAVVVPARAGVIPRSRGTWPPRWRRPRASGGHPSNVFFQARLTRSSPRERGSSYPAARRGGPRGVVPARAGVIPGRSPTLRPQRRRPRASGGHPTQADIYAEAIESSPRERGSSRDHAAESADRDVVPARAGVIRWRLTTPLSSGSRPRASGGHPPMVALLDGCELSSPRERGSSGRDPGRAPEEHVVPARAGVIRLAPHWQGSLLRRPRASGGHPPEAIAPRWEALSSPRERGSSDRGRVLG